MRKGLGASGAASHAPEGNLLAVKVIVPHREVVGVVAMRRAIDFEPHIIGAHGEVGISNFLQMFEQSPAIRILRDAAAQDVDAVGCITLVVGNPVRTNNKIGQVDEEGRHCVVSFLVAKAV
eukprot:4688189-Prymnesium_polylepis.1